MKFCRSLKTLLPILAVSVVLIIAVDPLCSVKWKSTSSWTSHTLAIREDGTLWAWGDNNRGQLGNGTTLNKSPTPIQIGNDSNWIAVAAGNGFSIALKADGTIWAWGNNDFGALGNGNRTHHSTPTPMQVGSDADWQSIAAGDGHVLAIKQDGSLWSWGFKLFGQLGLGNRTEEAFVPTKLPGDHKWLTVAAGVTNSLAVRADGTLWSWGSNGLGQLGDNSTEQKLSPVQVGTEKNWKNVSASHFFSIALNSEGELYAWGQNNHGQLGDGTLVNSLIPVRVKGDVTWKEVTLGYFHVLALDVNGFLYSWGDNVVGQLGDGTNTSRSIPTKVGAKPNWKSVATGYRISLAISNDGILYSWGENLYSQLGDSTDRYRDVPGVCPQNQVCSASGCVDKCIGNFFDNKEGFCVACQAKEFVSEGVCKTCDQSCGSCNMTANNCTSCPDGFFVQVPSSESEVQKCQNCSSNCRTCSVKADNCTSCVEGDPLNGVCGSGKNNGSGECKGFFCLWPLVITSSVILLLVGFCVIHRRRRAAAEAKAYEEAQEKLIEW